MRGGFLRKVMMIPLSPCAVYVLDRVLSDPAASSRMERILAGLGSAPKKITVITAENLPEVVAEIDTLWPPSSAPKGVPESWTRPLVFTLMEMGRADNIAHLLKRWPGDVNTAHLRRILGIWTNAVDQHPHRLDWQNDCVCWPTYNFGTMSGCPHGCRYCSSGREGKFIAVGLNIEEYMERVVIPVIETYPWNKVFRMILDGADLITFEPEYGLHELFADIVARYERWGYFHTASDNVEWLAHLRHRDRLIGVWTLTPDGIAREFEPGAPTGLERVRAAARCAEMGIPVRFKLKPVIPAKNWQEEYRAFIRQALTLARPESMGFAVYMWNSFESLSASLDLSLLDPDCVRAARDAREEMRGVKTGPFPHECRKRIYRFLVSEARRWDSEIPLYLSTESREMWDELKEELGQDPSAYICGCSSVAVPGRRLALCPGFRYSTYHPGPV